MNPMNERFRPVGRPSVVAMTGGRLGQTRPLRLRPKMIDGQGRANT